MPNPIYILFSMVDILTDIEATQNKIDIARRQMYDKPEFQEWMDREQEKLDRQRFEVELTMLSIRSQN